MTVCRGRHFGSIGHVVCHSHLTTAYSFDERRSRLAEIPHVSCDGTTEIAGPPKLPSEKNGTPIVERKPNEIGPPALSPALERRIRQQKILAELGVSALQGASFTQLLDDAARITAEGVQAEFCKVMEHIPTEKCFLVRAGVGWEPGIVGVATIGDDLASPGTSPCAQASRSFRITLRTRSDSVLPSYWYG